MFTFLNFDWLLKFNYLVLKFSGLFYNSIDFKSKKVEVKKHFYDVLILVLSFGLSLLGNTFDPYLPVAEVTQSKLLDIAVNLGLKASVWLTCFVKASNALQSNRFFAILSTLQSAERQVRMSFDKMILVK